MPSNRNSNAVLCAIAMLGLLTAATGSARAAYIHVYEGESIQAAIDVAVSGQDIILVHAGTYHESINLLGKEIWVDGIDGAALTTIDGAGTGQPVVKSIGGAGASISNFTITNGYAINGGGMYLHDAADYYVWNCIFDSNAATSHGGGMYISASTLSLNECVFTNNSATLNGGGIHVFNGASPTITNCQFTGNTADNFGGGLSVDEAGPTVTGCMFTSNTAMLGGGMRITDASAAVTDCLLMLNTATLDGGGMYSDGAAPLITNCVFLDNSASDDGAGLCVQGSSLVTATNCTFTENTAIGDGGGLFSSGGDTFLTNCILWDDSPDELFIMQGGPTLTVNYSDVQGGWTGTGNIDADPLCIDYGDGVPRPGRFSPCIDAGDNGAVPIEITTDYDGEPRFVDDADVADTGAGAPPIVDIGAHEQQQNSSAWILRVPDHFPTIPAAIAYAIDGDEIIVQPGTYCQGINFDGKAITLRSTDPTDPAVVAATVLDGQYSLRHVVRCTSGEGPDTVLSGFTITRGRADGESWPEYCGAGMLNISSNPTVTYCVFAGNSAVYVGIPDHDGFGGGMYNLSSSPTISHCTFASNFAHTYGGGLWNGNSSPALSSCTFTVNVAGLGGGMYCQDGSAPYVEDCMFLNNSTNEPVAPLVPNTGNGGAITITGDSSCTLVNTVFEQNYTHTAGDSNYGNGGDAGAGGALCIGGGASAVITNCTFLDNYTGGGGDSLFAYGGDGGDGGAIYSGAGCSITLTDCQFQGNYTGGAGGGLLGDGLRGIAGGAFSTGATTHQVSGTTFTANQARSAGALMSHASALTMIDCTFQANIAADPGGGMVVTGGGAAALTRCSFLENQASGGGGVAVSGASSASLEDCTLRGNDVAWGGGGIWMSGAGDVTLLNCLLAGNIATSGGGIFSELSDPFVTNCTLSGNTATDHGGGLYNTGGNPTLTNCILWGNSGSEEIYIYSGAPVVNYSDVQGGYFGDGNIDADPLFIGGGDLHLAAGSPCIDAANSDAVPVGVATDLDGNPRFVDDPNTPDTGLGFPCVDMGAYEFQYVSACPADVNGDGVVDVLDLLELLSAWGATSGPEDINGDGVVDVLDLLELLAAWGPC